MTEDEFKQRYYEAIGISPSDADWVGKASRALERAHDIRKFEIDLYWKRATYFWAFQIVAFASFGLLIRDGDSLSFGAIMGVSMFGFLAASAGVLIALGSKFWQDSWEAHVDMLEPADEARLSQVIVPKQRPQYSVTRVNQYLLMVIAAWWGVAFLYSAFPSITNWVETLPRTALGVAATIVLLGVAGGSWIWCRSRINGDAWYGSGGWLPYSSVGKVGAPLIIRRNRATHGN